MGTVGEMLVGANLLWRFEGSSGLLLSDAARGRVFERCGDLGAGQALAQGSCCLSFLP